MGFTWDYNLYVTPDFISKIANLVSIIEIFDRHNFGLRSTSTSKIRVYSDSELNEFDSEQDCFEFICKFGGMLQLWRTPTSDIGLALLPEGYMGTAQSPRISIYVDNTHYRKQDTESKAVAKSIESIYCELTSLAKAEYGYLDNERWETMDNPTLNSPLLFGVTIISLTVVENLPLDPIMEYTHHITHTNDGLVIFFSEFPWEIDIDLMPVINQMWHKIID